MPKSPRLQTFTIFVICAVVVSAAACYVYGLPHWGPAKTTFGNAVSVTGKKANSAQAISAANTDWQKDFLETSTLYGASKTQPTKASPTKKITATNQFGRDILSEYIKLKQLGLNSSTTIANNLTETILSKDYSSSKPKSFTLANVHSIPGNDAASLRAYANSLGAAMKAYSPKYDDAAVVLSSLKNQNDDYVTKIAANLKNYRALLTQLTAMPVPSSLAQNHLDLINGVSSMVYVDGTIGKIKTDPLETMNGLSLYSGTVIPLFVSSIGGIKDALRNAHVSFTAGESGSYFALN